MEKRRVAVIGAGPAGLAILKNLREEGFEATVFEKRDSIGGVWAFSDDPNITSTLHSTISNISKYGNSFTDFPIPDDLPDHLTAVQTLEYLKSYSRYFDLDRDICLNTSVNWVKRTTDQTSWILSIKCNEAPEEIKTFDRVVLCNGLTAKANVPTFEGQGAFQGKVIHAQTFKSPLDFEGQRVLIVGIGNSAADTSTQLIGHASKIFLSHRGGAKILPRVVGGRALDLVITRQKNTVKYALDAYLPSLSRWAFDYSIDKLSRAAFPNVQPEWRIFPAPSLAAQRPVISDNLIAGLSAGHITSVYGLKRFIGASQVELDDGSVFEVDTVILCTGYKPDFSLLQDVNLFSDDNQDLEKGNSIPRLYQNIFPPEHADSLAVMNYFTLTEGALTAIDLASMAIAQVWKGNYKLPPIPEMNKQISNHHIWVRELGKKHGVNPGVVRPRSWFTFMNQAADTGVEENLGYGLKGWRFWWRDRRMSRLMVRGVMTPFVYRYFEGRRRKWEGAGEAIVRFNELANVKK